MDECIDAGVQCPAPVVSICGGEPLIYKGIEDVVAGMLELRKNIDLCTNALKLTEYLEVFTPDPRLTFVVHLDGMREIDDYVCDYPGLWDIAVDAIKQARKAGFRVTPNTTVFKESSVDDVIEMMGYLTNEIGIDGMLIAPGYQYSQIDPALTMTRTRTRRSSGRSAAPSASTAFAGWRARSTRTSSPATGSSRARRGAPSRATPTGGRGPAISHRRDLPDLRGAAGEHRVGLLRAGERPALRTLRDPLRVRAVGRLRRDLEREGDRPEHGVDVDGLTFACATGPEERAARPGRAPHRTGRGMRRRGAPAGELVSFGVAGG